MAKEVKGKSKAGGSGAGEGQKEKPLPGEPAPLKRPGTSGTENLLMTNRRQASENFVRAQRAEKAYRAKKNATLARHNYNETKAHFRQGFTHLKLGVKGLFSVLRAVPFIVGEKQEERRRKNDARLRQRNLEQKKRIEEALARAGSTDADRESKVASEAEK